MSIIRQEKLSIYERVSLKLESNSLSSRDWWRTHKTFISPTSKSGIPPLYDIETDNSAVDNVDNVDKATVLSTFFAKQSSIDDSTHNISYEQSPQQRNKLINAWQKYMILAGFEPGPPG